MMAEVEGAETMIEAFDRNLVHSAKEARRLQRAVRAYARRCRYSGAYEYDTDSYGVDCDYPEF